MVCNKCGATIGDGANFCTECGARMGDAAEPVAVVKAEKKPLAFEKVGRQYLQLR